MPMDKIRLILAAGAGTAVAGLLFLAVADPTHGDMQRLDGVSAVARKAPRLSSLATTVSYAEEMAVLTQRPIFAMSTGAGAYAEKTFQLFGVSISPNRKAALVSVNGAPAVWFRAGELNGDVQLIDVDAAHARFDTPLGERSVGINDPAPAPVAASTGG